MGSLVKNSKVGGSEKAFSYRSVHAGGQEVPYKEYFFWLSKTYQPAD